MSDADLSMLTIEQIAKLISSRELSPVELTESYFDRIDRVEPVVNAFITLLRDRALASARTAADELVMRGPRSPLHGIGLAVKDLIDIGGVPTTGGSKALANRVPLRHADVVENLREAGAIILGKNNMHELALGGTNANEFFGPARNPRDVSRVPGGSSGGSAAAVVAGMCGGAIGTDTIGSVRIPSAFCGCVGFKPSAGLLSTRGVLPLAASLDHVGPIAKTVGDVALLLEALAGRRARPWFRASLAQDDDARLNLGVLGGYFQALLDEDVAVALDAAVAVFKSVNINVSDVVIPVPEDFQKSIFRIIASEAGPFHQSLLREHGDDLGKAVRSRMEAPAPCQEDVAASYDIVRELSARLGDVFREFNGLLLPTVPVTAPPLGVDRVVLGRDEMPVELVFTRLTAGFNAGGFPVATVPCGSDRNGLPIGMQVVADVGRDDTVLRLARRLEEAYRAQARPSRIDL